MSFKHIVSYFCVRRALRMQCSRVGVPSKYATGGLWRIAFPLIG